jgi:hypothetical protein
MSRKKWCSVGVGAMHESHHQAREENIFAMKNEKLISGCGKLVADQPPNRSVDDVFLRYFEH